MLAVGIGKIDSDAVCVYDSKLSDLDEECPLSCRSLVASVLGDCYDRNPNYRPPSRDDSLLFSQTVDPAVKGKTVRETLSLIAGLSYAEDDEPRRSASPFQHFTCRLWLHEELTERRA